jgi:hypothetical protein
MEGIPIDRFVSGRENSRAAAVARWLGGPWLLLSAIAAVVLLVSLPLLRGMALKENEMDAILTLRLLENEVLAAEGAGPVTLGEVVQKDDRLLRRLPDTCLMEGGHLLFRHGYLFELIRTDGEAPRIRAWPYSYGETGLGAFCTTPDGDLIGHPNRGPRWSGPECSPSVMERDSLPSWRGVSALLGRDGSL